MSQDPTVAAVEDVLGPARRSEPDPADPVEATFALWLCNCYSDDDSVPTWLVYDRAADGGLAWCRVPDRTEPLDHLVHAKDSAGEHTGPSDVLLWLQGTEASPWSSAHGGYGALVLEALRAKVLAD